MAVSQYTPFNAPMCYLADCNFDALSSQGRWGFDNDPAHGNSWGYGLVWICGDCWNSPPTFFHELGHNVSRFSRRAEVGIEAD